MYLALVRHGKSEWNLQNKWTGFTDIPLAPQGEEEAKKASELLKDINFDKAYTSDLKRAQQTLDIILNEINQTNIPVIKAPELKERDYGELTGMNKEEAKQKFGEEKFKQYRRSWDVPPPNGESLKNVSERSVPYFKKNILEDLKNGKNVIVAAHGNSLRSIIKDLDNLTPEQISNTEVATGEIWLYEFDKNGNIVNKEIRSIGSTV